METLQNQNVLLFTRTMGLGGTENVVLQLCEILNPVVNKVVVCSCGGVNEKRLLAMGIKHYTIPDIEKKDVKTVFSTLSQVKKIVKKEKITIVHVHHRMAAFYIALLKMQNNRLKFFATAHNTFTDKNGLTRFAYKNASVIACGEEVKTNLVEYYHLSKNKVAVIHNAVKPYMESIKPDAYLKKLKEDGYIIVGNIGRLSEQKGMEYFIDSYKKVHESIDKLKYVVVGQGEDEQTLKRKVKEENNQDNIIFLGYRFDIQNIIAQMDYIVLSSLWEGLPLTPIEAFSVHRPVIGTAVDGTKEIIENGNNGFLIAPRSAHEIAEKVIELAKNEKERLEMGEHAYTTYKEKFDFSVFQANVLNFYKQRI